MKSKERKDEEKSVEQAGLDLKLMEIRKLEEGRAVEKERDYGGMRK